MEAKTKNPKKAFYEAKGQSMGAVGAVITLIVGVGVAVLVLIFVGTLGGQTYQLTESKIDEIGVSTTTSNFTANNATAQSLGHTQLSQGTLTIYNGTENVGLGNFTIDYSAGTAKLIGETNNGTNMLASYDWSNLTVRNHVKDGIVSSFSALENTGDYLPVIVLAVVIALVLTLVLGFSSFGKNGGSMSAL